MDEYTTTQHYSIDIDGVTLELFARRFERMYGSLNCYHTDEDSRRYRQDRGRETVIDIWMERYRTDAVRLIFHVPKAGQKLADHIRRWIDWAYGTDQTASVVGSPPARIMTPEELAESVEGIRKDGEEWRQAVKEWWNNGGKDIITQEKLAEVLAVSQSKIQRTITPKRRA